ncbi:histidine kinase [Shewanella corallii]|uniref:Histidine kinase n=1 Tax=Shewanella corallii TaxID=560080 RepID=A0ABT0N3H8_9GAMM|nr:sensor histidine kinase [Shewanella corallii]MCL2912655.1 histidine kinase [Shewanella corallii]
MLKTIFLISIVLLIYPRFAIANFIPFAQERGLTPSVVTAILIDQTGMMWVGSREGLYRFDGKRVEKFIPDDTQPGSISDYDIRQLYQTRDGALWVATNTAGLNRLDPQTFEFTQYRHNPADQTSISYDSVYDLVEMTNGDIWVATQIGLNRLTASGKFERFTADNNPGSISHDYVYRLFRDDSDGLWLATIGGGVNYLAPGSQKFEHLRPAGQTGEPLHDDVLAILPTPDYVWIGTRNGLLRFDRKTGRYREISLPTIGQVFPNLQPFNDHQLLLATMSEGLWLLDVNTLTLTPLSDKSVGQDGQLPALPQLCITRHKDMLMVGTWGAGVYVMRLASLQLQQLGSPDQEESLRYQNILAISPASNGSDTLISSFGGGAQMLTQANRLVPQPDAEHPRAGVTSLLESASSDWWLGTTKGLLKLDSDGRELFHFRHSQENPSSIGQGYITGLAESSIGLWVGTGGDGLSFLPTGSTEFIHSPYQNGELRGDYIRDLLLIDDQYLWTATRSNGLTLCQLEPWQCHWLDPQVYPQLTSHADKTTSLYRADDGTVWLTTNGGGLYAITQDKKQIALTHYGSENLLVSDSIMGIAQESEDRYWITSDAGLSLLQPQSQKMIHFGADTGVPPLDFNAGAALPRNQDILLGTVNGLFSLPKGLSFKVPEKLPLQFTQLKLLNRPLTKRWLTPLKSSEQLNFRHDDIFTISYAMLDYSSHLHEYSYQLQRGGDWIDTGNQSTITFANLSGGEYQLTVRARDMYGQWQQSPILNMMVTPPFWQQTWFLAMLALLFLTLFFSWHHIRTYRLRQQNIRLEKLQKQKEHALSQSEEHKQALNLANQKLRKLNNALSHAKELERLRISRELHDELGQNLTATKLTLQLARKKQQVSMLDEGVKLIDRMINQVRNVALSMRPPLLDEMGLESAIKSHVASLSKLSQFNIKLAISPLPPLGKSLQSGIFRIIQEALNNIQRHADASSVILTLAASDQLLILTLEDDGKGFDPEEARHHSPGHLGLISMTERVEGFGGTINIMSKPGCGSRLEIRIPYENHQ